MGDDAAGHPQIVVPRYLYVIIYRIDEGNAEIAIFGVFHPARGSRPI